MGNVNLGLNEAATEALANALDHSACSPGPSRTARTGVSFNDDQMRARTKGSGSQPCPAQTHHTQSHLTGPDQTQKRHQSPETHRRHEMASESIADVKVQTPYRACGALSRCVKVASAVGLKMQRQPKCRPA